MSDLNGNSPHNTNAFFKQKGDEEKEKKIK